MSSLPWRYSYRSYTAAGSLENSGNDSTDPEPFHDEYAFSQSTVNISGKTTHGGPVLYLGLIRYSEDFHVFHNL